MIKTKNRIKSIVLICIVILVILINISICLPVFAFEKKENTDYIWLKKELKIVSTNKTNVPKLNSKCAIVFDRNSKSVIFGKNENKKVAMASTTKIMTAVVLLENLGKNSNLSLDTIVEVCKEAASIRGSRLGLKKGDKISINDLLYGLMLCSR